MGSSHRLCQCQLNAPSKKLVAAAVFRKGSKCRNLDHAANQLSSKLAARAQSHQRVTAQTVVPVPLINELLIEKHSEASKQHHVHVDVHAAVVVQRQNAKQVAVAIDARVALPVNLPVRLE